MSKDRPSKWLAYVLVLLLGIVFLGAVLRIWAIGGKSLWLDEAGTRARLLPSFRIMFEDVLQHDSHPPFYYVVLFAWSRFWNGVLDPSRRLGLSPALLRAFSALCSAGTIVIVYLTGKALFDRRTGLAAAALMALSAFHVFFAQEARLFALSGLLGVASSYLFVRCMQRNRTWDWISYAAMNLVCFYTYYYLLFLFLAQGVALVLILVMRAKGSRPASGLDSVGGLGLLWRWLAAGGATAILCLPLWPLIVERARSTQEISPEAVRAARVGIWSVVRGLQQFATGFFTWKPVAPEPPSQLLAAFVAISLVPLGWAILALWRQKREAAFCFALLLFPFVCVWVLPVKMHVFESKQLLFASPFYFLLVGAAAAMPHKGKLVGATSLAALVMCNVFSLAVYYDDSFQKEDWPEVARWISSEARPGDAVYVNPVWLRLAFDAYWEQPSDVAMYPGGEPRIWFDPVLLGRIRDSHARVWLIEGFSLVVGPDKRTSDWLRTHFREEKRFERTYFFGRIRVTLLGGGLGGKDATAKP